MPGETSSRERKIAGFFHGGTGAASEKAAAARAGKTERFSVGEKARKRKEKNVRNPEGRGRKISVKRYE